MFSCGTCEVFYCQYNYQSISGHFYYLIDQLFFLSKSTFKKIFPTMSHPQITNSSLIDHWLFNHRSNEFKCSLVCAGICPFFFIDMIELVFKNNNKKPLSLFTWKHSSDILVHADMTASHNYCKVIGCIHDVDLRFNHISKVL